MENFFGKMKNEMFYGHEYEFKTLEQLQDAMEKYIEYYNNERIQVKLKGLTPCQARNQSVYSFKNIQLQGFTSHKWRLFTPMFFFEMHRPLNKDTLYFGMLSGMIFITAVFW
jgi:putative transposase